MRPSTQPSLVYDPQMQQATVLAGVYNKCAAERYGKGCKKILCGCTDCQPMATE